MKKEDIKNRLQELLQETAGTVLKEEKMGTNLMTELDLSSLQLMMVLAQIEEEYQIELKEEVLRSFVSANDIVDYIASEVKADE